MGNRRQDTAADGKKQTADGRLKLGERGGRLTKIITLDTITRQAKHLGVIHTHTV
jgi:hypothetical protein